MLKKSMILAATLMFSGHLYAGADCTEHPEKDWMPALELQKKIVNEYGFAIKKFKTSGDCYEIYGWEPAANGDMVKVEVYFDTKTGAIVKKELD